MCRGPMLSALGAALLAALFAIPAGASNTKPGPAPTVPASLSGGSFTDYGTATPTAIPSPLGLGPRTAAGAPGAAARPRLRSPQTAAAAGPKAASRARVQTITSPPSSLPSGPTAASSPAAGIGPASPNLITHDSQMAFNGSDVAPPDTQLAAGPTAWLEAVNEMMSIRPRGTGLPGGDFDLNAFFAVPSGFFFSDPKVVYDGARGRWYLSGLAFNPVSNGSYVFLAVSSSSEPSGSWNRYLILDQSTSGLLCDQPHLGFSDDKVVVACDDFSLTAFVHDVVVVVDKASLLSGGTVLTATRKYADGDAAHFSLQPAYSMTSTTTQYLTYLWNGSAAGLIAITGNPATRDVNSFDTLSALPLSSFATLIPRAAQPGGAMPIDSGDLRLLSAVFSSGIIWTSAGDGCTPAGDTAQRACLRLVQLTIGGWPASGQPSRTQDYDVGASGKYLFYPALGMDASGTTYVSYNLSSAVDLPAMLASDILPAAAGGIDQTFGLTAGSVGAYTGPPNMVDGGSRWGDYSSAAPDPLDPHTVVVAG